MNTLFFFFLMIASFECVCLCHRVYCHPCIEKLCGDSELERVSGSHLSSPSSLLLSHLHRYNYSYIHA